MKTKTAKKSQQKIDKKNVKATAERITKEKVLKYKYPEKCDTLKERKRFRHTVRRTLERLEKQITLIRAKKIEGKVSIAKVALKEYSKEVLI